MEKEKKSYDNFAHTNLAIDCTMSQRQRKHHIAGTSQVSRLFYEQGLQYYNEINELSSHKN